MKTLREKLFNAIWRCGFAPDEDPQLVELKKLDWPDDVARVEKCADAAILALRQWLADEGLVVVPGEATDGMKDKVAERPGPWPRNGIREQFAREDRLRKWAGVGSMYAAMIAAAPDIPGET